MLFRGTVIARGGQVRPSRSRRKSEEKVVALVLFFMLFVCCFVWDLYFISDYMRLKTQKLH